MLTPENESVMRLDLKAVYESIDLRLRGREFRSEIRREGIPNSMPKTTRGKSYVDTRLGEEIKGGKAKLTRRSVGV